MSRAFVKDQDAYLEDLPDRPVSEYPNDVTEAGLAQIEHAVQAASEAYGVLRGRSSWRKLTLSMIRKRVYSA